ncbi:hypothetical protein RchiOBHm_Chr6g0264681 [Rosa chinensis]|uniref:Uncharacterized protein n=1 Tax=Rosa chinensis TaxID=74649 RepID=A0A2P6PP82_ROSCH|nr:hypothetical protein RchiOBHm_Chr6g0264681 [Rosa chinensis]
MFKPYILLSYFLYLDQFNLVSVFQVKMESQSPKMAKEAQVAQKWKEMKKWKFSQFD